MSEDTERPHGGDVYKVLKDYLGDGEIFNVHHLRRNVGDMIEKLEFENNVAGHFTEYVVHIDWGEEAGRGHHGVTEWKVIDHEFGGGADSAEQVYDHGILTGFSGLDEGEEFLTRTLTERGWHQIRGYKYGLILGDSITHVWRARSREGWPEFRVERNEEYAERMAQAWHNRYGS